jgi:hypothetical protein
MLQLQVIVLCFFFLMNASRTQISHYFAILNDIVQPYWAVGFYFSHGHVVVNVPYNFCQPMIFRGEDMSKGIRGFTIGYDYYAPEQLVCFHHYADGGNKRKRNKALHDHWENGATYSGMASG